MPINSYYEEDQSILNYIMSYGRRNSYGGGSYGGRRQSNFGGPKPVEIGKEYDVQVTERSDRGDGIARIQGFVILQLQKLYNAQHLNIHLSDIEIQSRAA